MVDLAGPPKATGQKTGLFEWVEGGEDCTGRLEKGLWLWVLVGAGPDHPAGSEPGFGHLKRYAV